MFGGARQWQRGDIEINRLPAAHFDYATVKKRDAQRQNVFAGRSITETAGPAGISRNVAADGRSIFGRIGSVKLSGCSGACLHLTKQRSRSDDRPALFDINRPELGER